jgi:hypothetical protein
MAVCVIVDHNNGQALAQVYFKRQPKRRAAANLLTKHEAHRLAANFAKPDSLQQKHHIQPLEASNQFRFCNLLAPVYSRFTAGYETLTLKEVKASPDELWSVSPLCFAISNNLNNNGRQEGDCKEH